MSSCKTFLSTLFLLAIISIPSGFNAASATTIEDKQNSDIDLAKGEEALLQGETETAITHLKAAINGADREKALFLLASTMISVERFEESLTYLDLLIKGQSAGKYFHKARFQKAKVYESLKRYSDAAAIYNEEVVRLLSGNRKEEVAQFYIKYAKRLCDTERYEKPKYSETIVLYRHALELELPDSLDEELRLKIAELQNKLGKSKDEERTLVEFKKRHPESLALDEADFRLAEIKLKSNRRSDARQAFRAFLSNYPDSPRKTDALYKIASTYRMPAPSGDKDLALGVKALEQFIEAAPDHKLAPRAAYEIGSAFYNRKRYDEAASAFEDFIDKYEEEKEIKELPEARFTLGAAFYKQKRYSKALGVLKNFLIQHSSHSLWDSAQRMIIEVEYSWCLSLEKNKEYDKACEQLLLFCLNHPLDIRTLSAYFLIGEIEEKRKNYKAAISEWSKLASKYSKSDKGSESRFRIGLLYETKMKDFESAIAEYKKVYGRYKTEAIGRIERMRAKSLNMVTERAFRSDQTPKVKIVTRNIESLSFKAYQVDLKDFFLKQTGSGRVENLDIDLIKPDMEWKSTVKGFVKYGEIAWEETPPFKTPGAYILNANDGERSATVLVLITDIQIIVKSGRKDILVFTENMRTSEPFEGAEVIVRDNGKVLFKGLTNSDGVLLKSDKRLGVAKNVEVFVASNNHFATNISNLHGVSAASGLTPKAYLFTDRTVYRPGSEIKLKGFIREVDDGIYFFDKDTEYTLSFLSPSGTEVFKDKVSLSNFGALDASVAIDSDAPLGTYKFTVKSPSGWRQSQNVSVLKYTPPKAEIVIDMPSDLYFPGETIKGKIKAFYSYGEPVRKKKVSYYYSSGLVFEKETDDNGEIPFEIKTKDFGESKVYTIKASLPEENASTTKSFHFSTTGFALNTGASRKVILAGESFNISVEARKPNGDLCEAEGQIRVIRLEEDSGVMSEREIKRIPFKIGPDEKKAVEIVSFEDGGSYRFRAAAKDRFGNLITSDTDAFVSGEKDKVKLRIFTDKAACDAGETVQIKAHLRCDPCVALLTCEGERIFEYKVLLFKKGDNTIPLNIMDRFAPNFTFAAAVMDDTRLHTAQSDFTVQASLNVSVEPDCDVAGPGEDLKLHIKVTDRRGEPVQSEIALALVDSALLARYPDRSKPIHDFFFSRTRKGRLLTQSSCGFSYKAKVTMIDQAIIDESHRMAWVGNIQAIELPGESDDEFDFEIVEELEESEDAVVSEDPATSAGLPVELRKKLKSLGYTGAPKKEGYITAQGMGGGAGGRYGGRRGRRAILRKEFPATAYWNPSVKTGADGKAEITIPLPHNITKWKILAKGMAKESSGGQAESSILVKKKLFAFLDGPAHLVEGDNALYRARVVNKSGTDINAMVTFKLDDETKDQKELILAADKTETLEFRVKYDNPCSITAGLFVTAGELKDSTERLIEVSPFGIPLSTGARGTANASRKVKVSLPDRSSNQEMKIVIGPEYSEILMHLASDVERYYRYRMPSASGKADKLLVQLHTLGYLRRTGREERLKATDLDEKIEQSLANLILKQSKNGSFSWIDNKQESVMATAQALKALSLAHGLGFNVPEKNISNCLLWIKNKLPKLDGLEKIFSLNAVSFAEPPEFTFLNKFYRNRNSLDNCELAMLATAFYRSGYKDQAVTLIKLAMNKSPFSSNDDEKVGRSWTPSGPLKDRLFSDAQVVWAAALILKVDKELANGVDKITNSIFGRSRSGWAKAACAGALSEHLSSASLEKARYRLSIAVNGKPIKTLNVNGPTPVQTIFVPHDAVAKGKNIVDFAYEGRGSFAWSILLTGFSSEIKPYAEEITQADPFRIYRTFIRPPITFKGKKAASYNKGWDTVVLGKDAKKFINKLSQVNEGDIALVELETDTFYNRNKTSGNVAIAITDTLPAGVAVIENGIEGNHCQYEMGDGEITFYFNNDNARVVYPIYGAFQGDYRTPPPVMRSLCDFGLYAHGDKAVNLKIKERNTPTPEPYRMKPDELYYFGMWSYKEKDFDKAKSLLTQYMDQWTPKSNYLAEAATKLFKIAFIKNNDKDLVRYFELLREQVPSLTLSFQETARVASSYCDLNEHEQALQLLSMIAGASFGRESKVAEVLEKQDAFKGSVEYMRSLILAYPDLPVVQTALFALSQQVVDRAGKIVTLKDRQRLTSLGLNLLKKFLIRYPMNPVADEAAYSLISIWLDQEKCADVTRLCPIFQKRWPNSKLSSSIEYAEAYALFETDRYDEAKTLLKKVADRPSRRLTPLEKDDRDLARYILAQIEHACGRIKAAIERYLQVKEKFIDAAEVIEYFTRKSVSLPEVSTIGSTDKVFVDLTYKNTTQVKLSVYKVDLMKLYLARKSLNTITDINLAGITPIHAESIQLGNGDDYKEMKKRLDLPLKDKGAYLLVVQGDEVGCSGMVLKSDLKLDVQEDATSGSVRVNVKNSKTGAFQKNVYMKLIGSSNSSFQSGFTDLRGVFTAEDISGVSTVIAEKDGEYAFHRGLVTLQSAKPRFRADRKQAQEPKQNSRNRALKNILDNGYIIRNKGQQLLNDLYKQTDEGVKIK